MKHLTDQEIISRAAAIHGAKGGKSRSEKKQEASRRNGKLGGRNKRWGEKDGIIQPDKETT